MVSSLCDCAHRLSQFAKPLPTAKFNHYRWSSGPGVSCEATLARSATGIAASLANLLHRPIFTPRLGSGLTVLACRLQIYCMQWSQNDSKLLVSGAQDGRLILWDALSGNKMQAVPLTSRSVARHLTQ